MDATTTSKKINLDDLLVRHAGKEDVLFILVWMETNDIWDLPVAKTFQALPSFCIP